VSSGGTLRRQMVSITGLLVADGLGTVLPVVLLLVLVGLCRGWVWLPNCVIPPPVGRVSGIGSAGVCSAL
jgi:hypothetical protein